jgi:predicted GIY-YIG superfamily endonuclease
MLLKFDESLNILEQAISQEIKFKSKAKKSKSFEQLFENPKFQKLTI